MLARWNPWQGLWDLQREMDDMFRHTFPGEWTPVSLNRRADGGWMPAIDVFSRQNDLVVRAELPGIDPQEDVDISVHDGVLTIAGERKKETRSNGDDYFRVESSYGSFRRHVALPEGVKPEDIQASYENGILEVVVPRAAELSAPKKVQISIGSGRRALTTKGGKK